MAARKVFGPLRSSITRLVLVAGLAVAVFAGSLSLAPRPQAEAATLTCEQTEAIANVLLDQSKIFSQAGNQLKAFDLYVESLKWKSKPCMI
jgi:hypothetical protein